MDTRIDSLQVSTYVVPTDGHESDGTFSWDQTKLVVVELGGGGKHGLGYTYANQATAHLVDEDLRDAVLGHDAMDVPAAYMRILARIRNLGRSGIAAMALSAVDAAMWDLKARIIGLSLVDLLGAARAEVAVYGSGGFTSYSERRLCEQLRGWVDQGIPRVKMKIGRVPEEDVTRVRAAREAIGDDVELFVDANGAYDRKTALAFARRFRDLGVTWFEEPVSSDDLDGLRLLRDRAPGGMQIAAGEYGFALPYFAQMLAAGAVDTLQADASRCGGITGFRDVAVLCRARSMRLSGHCAPSLHAHVACACPEVVHLEWFHDHARIERMLFDGALTPRGGALAPDRLRPGIGLELKTRDAKKFAA